MDYKKIKEDLMDLNVGNIKEHEPMYKHTTYKVGGPARLFVSVNGVLALKKLIAYIKKHKIRFFIIGKGSNLLFSDKEFEGIIIFLNEEFEHIHFNGSTVLAGAGVSMIKLAYETAKTGLSGFEFMGGIPGSIGGGIYMNAGAYKCELQQVVKEVTIINSEGQVETLTKEQMKFGYRHSILQEHRDWIVVAVLFELETKDPNEIKELLDLRKERRMMSQPWNLPSAGSVFRNPSQKAAWQYIDEAGLRGYEIGGAKVSLKHSNFIVNNGYASAKDIYDLILLVQKTVKEKFGVTLRPEVGFINWE